MKTHRYVAEVTRSGQALGAIQAFRARCFGLKVARDSDRWDAVCDHIVVRRNDSRVIVGCCRFNFLSGTGISSAYSGQFYNLGKLETLDRRALELGRFCVDTTQGDPDILRLMWAVLTGYVDSLGVDMLFGCASFTGTNPAPYAAAFAFLQSEAQLRNELSPVRKASNVHVFASDNRQPVDRNRAFRQMPPLLRCYLGLGAAVSDHAVMDTYLNTLHVFTLVETAAIPPARKKWLRGLRKACLVGRDCLPETN